jgi:aldehyde:ferredoxin oxidoreductase
LWGRDIWQSTAAIRKEINDNAVQVAAIGPAGKNLKINPALIATSIAPGIILPALRRSKGLSLKRSAVILPGSATMILNLVLK